jgi:Putative Actinobacterial Holin-X, holin superfamily III
MRPTLELLGELAEQTRSLAQVEVALVRAELSERSALVSSSLTKVGAGVVCLPIGAALFLVAVSLALRRFGIPADLAFLIVALFVIAAGAFSLISGLRGLKPSRLAPSKSISQISSLLGELQDGADVR